MQLNKCSLFGKTTAAQDGVAVIHQVGQALLPACSQRGGISVAHGASTSLCPAHLFVLEDEYYGDANLVEGLSSVRR